MILKVQKFFIDKAIKTIIAYLNPNTNHQDHRTAHNLSMVSTRRNKNNIFYLKE